MRSTNVSEICSHGTRQLRYWDRARDDHVMAEYGLRPSDQLAPIVRNSADGGRELVMARWGMPGPPQFGGQPVTNNPQRLEAALAQLAFGKEPLPRASDIVRRRPGRLCILWPA